MQNLAEIRKLRIAQAQSDSKSVQTDDPNVEQTSVSVLSESFSVPGHHLPSLLLSMRMKTAQDFKNLHRLLH